MRHCAAYFVDLGGEVAVGAGLGVDPVRGGAPRHVHDEGGHEAVQLVVVGVEAVRRGGQARGELAACNITQ